jgi:hypothetical protein
MKLFVGGVVKGGKIVSMGVKAGFLLSQQSVDPLRKERRVLLLEPLAHQSSFSNLRFFGSFFRG